MSEKRDLNRLLWAVTFPTRFERLLSLFGSWGEDASIRFARRRAARGRHLIARPRRWHS